MGCLQGRWVERADAQREKLNPGIHLVIRGSPALWNIVGHVKNGEKIDGGRKTGLEYGKSTEKSTPGKVENDRKGRDVKGHGNQEESEGNKPQKGGNGKRGTETKICSVENVRNANKIANLTTKRA